MQSYLLLCLGLLPTWGQCVLSSFDARSYSSSDVITRDVAIIGGGATGTYSAFNLQKAGKSVIVVEKEAVLGGHTNTYTDPTTGVTFDYGVQAFWNISVVRDFFALLNISTTKYSSIKLNTSYIDFQTGEYITSIIPSDNYTLYSNQLQKYSNLLYNWNLPSPVPEDLLMPFGDFITKYDLQDIAYSLYTDGQGFADFLEQPTVNFMKMVDGAFLDTAIHGNSLVPEGHNNGQIFTKALAMLGQDVLLSSTVKSAQRSSNQGRGVQLVVDTPSGQKMINASQLLITIPPLLDNMQPFSLDPTESTLFSQWSYTTYFVLVVNNTGLPPGYHFANANSSTATHHIPQLPAPYQITQTRVPGLFYIWYASPHAVTQSEVEADVAEVIGRLRVATNSTVTAAPQVVEIRSHTPFKLVVGADAIRDGFYGRLENLQGHLNTWYTGAAFLSHDASVLWNFTQSVVVPDMLAA